MTVKEFAAKLKAEIQKELNDSYQEKERIHLLTCMGMHYDNDLVNMLNGKITILIGINNFIDELIKEMEVE